MHGLTRYIVIAALVLVLLAPRAAADTVVVPPEPVFLHIVSNSTLRTDTSPDVDLRLPPGYFLDEPTYTKVDTEMRRLQNAEHRLAAENRTMRARMDDWQPGIYVLATAVVLGLAGGVYLGYQLHTN